MMTTVNRAGMEGILFTDQYQLTMAQLYFRAGLHERTVQFEHFFRRYPAYDSHQAGYCVNAGLAWLLDWMSEARFHPEDLDYLRSQRDNAGNPLFADDFLGWLGSEGNFGGITMHAIPEGRVVHPHTPLTVVEGPLAMAQILETALLAHLNYQTLIATKASRMWESGRGRPILEFGLRRAQERGANAGARAALIGGASFTSNVGVSRAMGLSPKGTHAHSLVQLFMAMGEGELAAFQAYADLYPDDCLFLVDTVDTLSSGVPHAIKVFEALQRKGHKPVGIRLDSGDLAYLSIQAAKLLNDAGFADTSIVLSGDLDELVIWQIITQISQEAPRYGLDADHLINRLVFGVGTRLITSWGEPALGGRPRRPTPAGKHCSASMMIVAKPLPTSWLWMMKALTQRRRCLCATPPITPNRAPCAAARFAGWSHCCKRSSARVRSSTSPPPWTPCAPNASPMSKRSTPASAAWSTPISITSRLPSGCGISNRS
jgi:nicotinate phosphoribosyltransferase